MSFRAASEKDIFEMYVAKLQQHSLGGSSSFKLDPTKPALLNVTLQAHYATLADGITWRLMGTSK